MFVTSVHMRLLDKSKSKFITQIINKSVKLLPYRADLRNSIKVMDVNVHKYPEESVQHLLANRLEEGGGGS